MLKNNYLITMKLFIKIYSNHSTKVSNCKLLLDFIALSRNDFSYSDISKNNKFMLIYQINDKSQDFLTILARYLKNRKITFYWEVRA